MQLGLDAEMIGNRHHLEGARAWGKHVKFDRHGLSPPTVTFDREVTRTANNSLRLDSLPEAFEHSRPAAVDVLAHLLAAFGAHLLELAMFKLDARRVRAVGNEPDLNLGTDI